MCGIFGFLIPNNSQLTGQRVRTLLCDLFLLSESRGKESAGLHVYLPTERKGFTLKGAVCASELIETECFADLFESAIGASFCRDGTNKPLVVIAHSRLVTNGAAERHENNQPVNRFGATVVHNGIVVNVDSLWNDYPEFERTAEVDTEIIAARLGRSTISRTSPPVSTRQLYADLKGAASIAWVHDRCDFLALSTNTGDLYTYADADSRYVVFASERYILTKALTGMGLPIDAGARVRWLEPGRGILADISGELSEFSFVEESETTCELPHFHEQKCSQRNFDTQHQGSSGSLKAQTTLLYNEERMKSMRRCSCCVLPETFPFIEFDSTGKCNYCHSYQPRYKNRLGEEAKGRFIESLAGYRRGGREPDCLVAFSGGRDSSYGLHLIKKEFGLTPVTFTYDWGMVTDLARRNIARICGELGIQNILVSADIKVKRDNIRKNVSAWLKKPDLGMIPLFMAGDKHFFRVVNQLKKQTGIALDLWCANPLENTDFKSGFCGIAPDFGKSRVDYLSLGRKVQMASYYASRFATNPSYMNRSLTDTFGAFTAYYFEPRKDFYFIFDHFPWEEQTVNSTLISSYDWETAADTTSTWRIGDGTAPFYNYIYLVARGFSEFDTFRSNQIREGMIGREDALANVLIENRPRETSIRWYLETIGLEFDQVVPEINKLDTMGLHSD